MSKPNILRTVTGADCLNYVNNAVGFISASSGELSTINDYRVGLDLLEDFVETGELSAMFVRPSDYQAFIRYVKRTEYIKVDHNNRMIGLILGENDDGSYKIAVLGSDDIDNENLSRNYVIVTFSAYPENIKSDDTYDWASLITYGGSSAEHTTTARVTDRTGDRAFSDAIDYKLELHHATGNTVYTDTFYTSGKYRGNTIAGYDSHLQLSNNKNNTLVLGIPVSEMVSDLQYNSLCYMYDTYNSIFEAWEGDFYTMLQNIYAVVSVKAHKRPAVVVSEGNNINMYTQADDNAHPKLAGYERKTHAFQFTPFNLILTRSESQALAYLNNGTVPSDAFLYPLDWENLPRTDGTPSSDDESTDDTDYPNPNGDSGIDGTPTTDADPTITTNMLNNNNLYWLQAGQLEAFITWFWQHAGEIIDLEDAWQKLTGLYNNIAEAIVNIRYFPVDPYYIGGVSDTTNIILSSIEMEITGIKKLNKGKLVKRTLGGINIPKKYGMYTDYSPYTSLMLYLPFHAWIELDIDIFVGNRLEVRCVYDHISGTIQYGIYVISKGKEFLVNSCVAKMAVDIPITLQSKSDRDSAIFQNVASGVGNFLGAGASIAQGNPIGLVMSTGGLASGGSQSAPLKTMGTMGESGAFFLPNKCAYYIKRPSYNIPSDYASRVGYPSNQGGKLSSFRGLTVVYNPQISFKGNENADGVTMKPLESEIKEIYELLEKGVII